MSGADYSEDSTGVFSEKVHVTNKEEVDDADIAGGATTVVVINLNYVWDSVNSKWVRMTQP